VSLRSRAGRMIQTAACMTLLATPVAAQTLSFPGNAEQTAEAEPGLDTLQLATGPWTDGTLPVMPVEGEVRQEAWLIRAGRLTTLQLLRPLREQLANAGFDTVFECETEGCGGFDFRFAIPVMLPPAMQVNLADFRYLSALRTTGDTTQAVTLLVSRTPGAGHVQIMTAGTAPETDNSADAVQTTKAMAPGSLSEALETTGRAVLTGVDFDTGSVTLSSADIASLRDLAAYLSDHPDRSVALVGHTDVEGSLDGNIGLSKRRAGTVLERLVADYGVPRRQLTAEGNGYLSPIASNLTEAGREANRRVEVIVLE